MRTTAELIRMYISMTEEDGQTAEAVARQAFSREAIAELCSKSSDFISGSLDLKALDFFLLLESATPLTFLHLLLRKGDRNRLRNGLQQSYGDHNRILALAIDKLTNGDIIWYEDRVSEAGCDLAYAIGKFGELEMSRSDQVLLWIAASLHDYGKLIDRGFGLDAEDALYIARPLLEALCEAPGRGVIQFGIRNHDLVEYVLTGETPVPFLLKQLDAFEPGARALGHNFLGIIQLAGAASLGEGRITKRKIEIYNDCLDGIILADRSTEARLVRLLEGERRRVSSSEKEGVAQIVASLAEETARLLEEFLATVVLRGWKSVTDAFGQDSSYLIQFLVTVAVIWDGQRPHCDFVVFESAWNKGRSQAVQRLSLLNGVDALVFGSGPS